MTVYLLVAIKPDPLEDETPESLPATVAAAINGCHVHGLSNEATVTLHDVDYEPKNPCGLCGMQEAAPGHTACRRCAG